MVQVSYETPGSKIRYFPYSVGVIWTYATTYASISENYNLKEIVFLKEPISEIVERMVDPDVLVLSSYIWNQNYNLALAEKVKLKWPSCKIIIGGPSVPDDDVDYFKKHPFVDYLIHHEGEISFSGLLRSFVGDINVKNVPGISINHDGVRYSTGASKRIDNLSGIPSPYTSGLFDHILEKANRRGITLNGIIETNRGCPFQCTFCDWGGTTFSKIKKFNMERISAEIEWFGKNKIELITNTDANFGIFKSRDYDITDTLIGTKKKYGYPMIFDTCWNKNSNNTCVDLAEKLMDAKMMRRFSASVQSMNPDTLDAIKRVNLNGEQLSNLAYTAKGRGIIVSTELIVGLPEETYDTWKDGVCRLIEDGFTVEAYPLTILPNSRMNNTDYKEKYGIKSKTIESGFSNYITETSETVIATKDIDEKSMEKIYIWTWLVQILDTNGFCNFLSRYLKKRHGIPLDRFYEKILQISLKVEDTVLHTHLKKMETFAKKYRYDMFLMGWHNQEVLEDIGLYRREDFFKEIYQISDNLVVGEDPNLESVCMIQKLQQAVPDLKEKQILPCRANLYEYVEQNKNLVVKPTTYVFDHKGISDRHKNWFAFMNFSRKSSAWKIKVEQKSQ